MSTDLSVLPTEICERLRLLKGGTLVPGEIGVLFQETLPPLSPSETINTSPYHHGHSAKSVKRSHQEAESQRAASEASRPEDIDQAKQDELFLRDRARESILRAKLISRKRERDESPTEAHEHTKTTESSSMPPRIPAESDQSLERPSDDLDMLQQSHTTQMPLLEQQSEDPSFPEDAAHSSDEVSGPPTKKLKMADEPASESISRSYSISNFLSGIKRRFLG